jgi:predicted nucleotidyltransferase
MSFQTIKATLSMPDLKAYIQSCNVRHLRVAWSFAHQTQTDTSDIDIVYEENDTQAYNINIFSIPQELEKKYFFTKVDFIDKNNINKHIASSVLSSMIPIW